jgi:hypothetical protein
MNTLTLFQNSRQTIEGRVDKKEEKGNSFKGKEQLDKRTRN